jgi:23S rRNA (cytidine1920-2'-O)/16S rRNA (cytidine1409-2'-O)-methyltransferase
MISHVTTAKTRLDTLLVKRGLVDSRQKAQALILAGQVLVNSQKVDKCGAAVTVEADLRLLGDPLRYVSRAGVKLEAALNHFRIDPKGMTCLDIGASTGGFTDCLLQRGATRVLAVDVGTNQLDWKLRCDPRVVSMEKTNARYLTLDHLGSRIALAVMDVSFISSTLILPALPALLEREADVIVLVKPQFEVGRGQVGKGGIIRDPRLQEQAVAKVSRALLELGFTQPSCAESALTGAGGNREYFLHALWRECI